MEAGKLNRRITLQVESINFNSVNEPIPTWTDLATIWAQVITTGGREFYTAQKQYAEVAAVFRVRYSSRYNARMRIKYGNRYFAILGEPHDPDGSRIELLISAKEAV